MTEDNKAIVPREWFAAAVERYQSNPAYWDNVAEKSDRYRHGLDVGDTINPHTIARWRGNVLCEAIEIQDLNIQSSVNLAVWGLAQVKRYKGTIAIERAGIGAGVLTGLTRMIADEFPDNNKVRADGFVCSNKAQNSKKFFNLKTEIYWSMREAFRLGKVAVAIADLETRERLADELAAIYYEEVTSQETLLKKIRIEKEHKTFTRLRRSPNLANSVMMAWHDENRIDCDAEESETTTLSNLLPNASLYLKR